MLKKPLKYAIWDWAIDQKCKFPSKFPSGHLLKSRCLNNVQVFNKLPAHNVEKFT